MIAVVTAALASPWAGCVERSPPDYSATPTDYITSVDVAVKTGDQALPFSLRRAVNDSQVSLHDLLAEKPVMLQFGAYT
jgi:hypothetical protein